MNDDPWARPVSFGRALAICAGVAVLISILLLCGWGLDGFTAFLFAGGQL